MFERIQSTIFEVRSTLKNSEKIRKLVYHDSNAALSMNTPTVEQVDKYILTQPIFDMCETNTYDINTLIQIEIGETEPIDNTITGVLQVNVVCNAAKWNLVGNKIRVIEIAEEVVRLVNNKKFSISNTLEFVSMTPLLLNKTITGYSLLFNLIDGSGNINNF